MEKVNKTARRRHRQRGSSCKEEVKLKTFQEGVEDNEIPVRRTRR